MANRSRTVNFSMRVREEDEVLLDAKKDDFSMSRSEYLRNLILFAPAKERAYYSCEFAENLYKRLHMIGNALNEIAHTVNGRHDVRKEELEEMKCYLFELLAVYDEFVRDNVTKPY